MFLPPLLIFAERNPNIDKIPKKVFPYNLTPQGVTLEGSLSFGIPRKRAFWLY